MHEFFVGKFTGVFANEKVAGQSPGAKIHAQGQMLPQRAHDTAIADLTRFGIFHPKNVLIGHPFPGRQLFELDGGIEQPAPVSGGGGRFTHNRLKR